MHTQEATGLTMGSSLAKAHKSPAAAVLPTVAPGYPVLYLFFISLSSRLRVASSASCWGLCRLPGEAAITTPCGKAVVGARIW